MKGTLTLALGDCWGLALGDCWGVGTSQLWEPIEGALACRTTAVPGTNVKDCRIMDDAGGTSVDPAGDM